MSPSRVILKIPLGTVIWVTVVLAIIVNLLAYRHAKSFLNYKIEIESTAPPESLTWREKMRTLIRGANVKRSENSKTPASENLDYKTFVIETDDSVSLEIWDLPGDDLERAVILFPGYASAKSSLLPEAKAINEMGYSTVLVDFRGCGGSQGSSTTLGINEALDVKAAFEYARDSLEYDRIVLLGQSMGASAVLRAVSELDIKPDGIIIESIFDRLINAIRNRFKIFGIPEFPFAELLLFWGGFQGGFDGFQHNPVDYARDIKCPVALLQGSDDQRALLSQSRNVYESLTSARSIVYGVFQGASHEALISNDSETWSSTVNAFIKYELDLPQQRKPIYLIE